MNNDLISRSALLEELEKYVFDTMDNETRRAEHIVKAYVLELIERQPAAYDTDKVIEQLKAEGCIVDDAAGNRAVEIIEGGGVNEKDEN